MDLRTDGIPSIDERGRSKTESTLVWDGEVLVLRWNQFRSGRSTANGEVRYSLAGDVFTAEEQMVSERGRHRNVWVFRRAP
jgi:hypothetical protein